jgi:DNA-directed RNA polymerase specialized sigma24 family protein
MTAKPEKEADALLRTFLDEADEARCDRLLEEIICQHARPIIRRVVASKLNVGRGRCDSIEWQEQEDIAEEVVVQLIRHLSTMRGAGADAFGSFDSYVATAAYNACSNYLRRKYPERSRLRNRLRYILSHHEQLGMWRSGEREWLCGLVSWKNQRQTRGSSARLRQLSSDPRFVNFSNSSQAEREVLHLVTSIFDSVGAPVAFDEMVDVVGDIIGMSAKSSAEPNGPFIENTGEIWSKAEAFVTDRIDRQGYLKKVWKEICQLPPEQRAALLLNLKDKDGSDITVIFVTSGVTTISEMADVLDTSIEEFLDMWKKLPLSDEEIAIRLGISVRKVGSLRQAGRRRLCRRMD